MRIVFFGSGAFGCPTLERIAQSEHEILEVITQPARPAGRGKKLQPTPIAEKAQELDLAVRESADVNTDEFIKYVESLQPELLLVIAFGQKMGKWLLSMPNCRSINLHGSLLPAYRGAAPINWAIIKGEKRAGITVIELNEVWDGGAMLGKAALDVGPLETAGELHDRLAALGPDLVYSVISQMADGADAPISQDESKACKAGKLTKADAAIAWDRPAHEIKQKILGMWPWPGAYAQLQQQGKEKPERVSLVRAQVAQPSAPLGETLKPGMLTDDLLVACGEGFLQLLEVRPDNSRVMDFKAFANGRRLTPGDQFLNG